MDIDFTAHFAEMPCDVWTRLSQCEKPIALYGTGDGADKIAEVLAARGIPVAAVFASDGFVRNRAFRGFPVESYRAVRERLGNFVALVCFGTKRPEVLDNIAAIAAETELYAPDVPVYGTGLFDEKYFREVLPRLERVFHRLADDTSKKTFISCLKYRLTGRTDFLFSCETPPEEDFLTLLCPKPGCTYVDVGAYTGDTVEAFCRYAGREITVAALEPDAKNYRKLVSYASESGIRSIKTYPAAAWSRSEKLTFYPRAGKSGSAADIRLRAGMHGVTVDAVPLALLVPHADYIKIDAEGTELEVLIGAAPLLTKDSSPPALTVAAYHRTADYFEIPEAVLGLRDDYRVYFRHYRHIPCWDTYFYFLPAGENA